MATVRVELPILYKELIGTTRFTVHAGTLKEALEVIQKEKPLLRKHLFSRGITFRPHVLCFLNQENTQDMPTVSVRLNEGDKILFHQAISGG